MNVKLAKLGVALKDMVISLIGVEPVFMVQNQTIRSDYNMVEILCQTI